jgi:hypothetical protein
MKKSIALLTQLNKRYNITDFYVVTLYDNSINLQGKLTRSTMEFFNLDPSAPVNSHKFIERQTRFGSITIKITLTY